MTSVAVTAPSSVRRIPALALLAAVILTVLLPFYAIITVTGQPAIAFVVTAFMCLNAARQIVRHAA